LREKEEHEAEREMEKHYVVDRTAIILSIVTIATLEFFVYQLSDTFLYPRNQREFFTWNFISVVICLFLLQWALPIYFSVYNYKRTGDRKYFLFILVALTQALYFFFPIGLLIYAAVERRKANGLKRKE
jgi:hypothetical protein